jgi:hypothetical protein
MIHGRVCDRRAQERHDGAAAKVQSALRYAEERVLRLTGVQPGIGVSSVTGQTHKEGFTCDWERT